MKKIDMNIDFLKNNHGLSCVENLVMYILKANNITFQYLFFESFLTYSEIENAFATQKQTYATFNIIPRIQNVAEKEGIIKMVLLNHSDIPQLNSDYYMMVMVSPEFEKNRYNKELWRDDHYILVSPNSDTEYNYINDNPLDIGKISMNELKKYYNGKAIFIDISNQSFLKAPSYYINHFINTCHIDIPCGCLCNDIITLRDIVGVLRVLRKRMYSLLVLSNDVEYMIPYLKSIDQKYMLLEYMRMRKQNNLERLKEIRNDIILEDNKIIEQLVSMKLPNI